ncbi:hypothetical protein RW115_00530 [Macrococcus capreoli]
MIATLFSVMMHASLQLDIDQGVTQHQRQQININQYGVELFNDQTISNQQHLDKKQAKQTEQLRTSLFDDKESEDLRQSKAKLFTKQESFVSRPTNSIAEDDSPVLTWGVIVIFICFELYILHQITKRSRYEKSY